MKDINEIIKQFDNIKELPVSEEMLGAYMEGNLDGAEFREVYNIVEKDYFVADLILSTDKVMQINNDLSNLYIDTNTGEFCNNADSQLINTNDFVITEGVLDKTYGIDIIHDTVLSQLERETINDVMYHNNDEIYIEINDCDDINNDF